jgi:hypothetical protein
MALCLKHSVLTLYHPGNILFQTMLVNSDVLLVPNILNPFATFRNWRSPLTTLQFWTIMCREYHTQCACQGQLNLIVKNLFGMITE